MEKKLFIILLLLAFIFVGCGSGLRETIKEKRTHINNLVHIGMDLDKAIRILKDNDYRVGEKHIRNSYIFIYIPLVDRMPVRSTLTESVGLNSNAGIYVVIKSGLDNKITSIE